MVAPSATFRGLPGSRRDPHRSSESDSLLRSGSIRSPDPVPDNRRRNESRATGPARKDVAHMEAISATAKVGNQSISIETGKLAKQADGSVVLRAGDSMVLVTAVSQKEPKPG